ncbi:glycosyltransferase [Stenotrophomonas maltophilia]|uniref:glycosyltransferase n=1 Tax=Stenotrophomonas maltophilia TaxID=40324 RepID=UPI001310DE75|nr:hypothetical protein PGKDCPLP_00109 [Stenotrophomonas maltophilia]
MAGSSSGATRVLVVLAYFNGADWIEAQVNSVLSQEGVDVRVVVFDDCSASHLSAEMMVGGIDSRVAIYSREVGSGGAGQNFLRALRDIWEESFDFLAFCDQDDIWDSMKLSRAVDALNSEEAVGYSSSVRAVWPDGSSKVLAQSPVTTDLDFLFEGAGQGCTFVITKNFARRLDALVRDNADVVASLHYHDWFIYAMSRALRLSWIFDPVPSMMYRQHERNDTGARTSLGGVLARVVKIRGGWYASQVTGILHAVRLVNLEVLPRDFMDAYQRRPGIIRRVSLARILLARGRRRLLDRGVLAFSALCGWV